MMKKNSGSDLTVNRFAFWQVAIITTLVAVGVVNAGGLVQGQTSQAAKSPLQNPIPERVAFEVVSIRPSAPALQVSGARGAGGGSGEVLTCADGQITIDPRRFVLNRATLFWIIQAAYRTNGTMDCFALDRYALIAGPEWIKSQAWDIQALMPEGTPSYKSWQWPSGTPQLRRMVQTMLADRFKLVLRRETREIPVYLLKVAKGGAKFNGHPPRPPGSRFIWDNGDGVIVGEDKAEGFRVGFGPRDADGKLRSGRMEVWNTPLSELTSSFSDTAGRIVLDRTGITDKVNFNLTWFGTGIATSIDPLGLSNIGGASLSRVLSEIGLQLEDAKAPVEVWVIDQVDKPSEN